ncbi:MAG: hypothetical protein PHU85_12250 [Phycisphaerae bacterium]|nr:hypothetical protein [Phycisphaerae bacterium]
MSFPRTVLLIACLAVSAAAIAADTTSPATQPAASQSDWPAELTGPGEFSPADREAFGRVADQTEGLDELAFYVLLDHASDVRLSEAVRASLAQLKASPASDRSRPVRVGMRYVQTEPFLPARPKPYGKLYETIVYSDSGETIKVVSSFKPCELTPGQRFEAVGYFHKLQSCTARDSNQPMVVPVLVVNRIAPLETKTSGFDARVAVVLGAIVVALLVWLISQRRRRRQPDRTIEYRITPCDAPAGEPREGPKP